MAEKNVPVNTPAKESETLTAKGRAVMAGMVMAARLKKVQDLGIFNPKMQRGFDRMIASIEKGGK